MILSCCGSIPQSAAFGNDGIEHFFNIQYLNEDFYILENTVLMGSV